MSLSNSDNGPYDLIEQDGPLVVAAPHVGTAIPEPLKDKFNATGLLVNETDFHVHRLFDFAKTLGASQIAAHWSRYVIDLNRASDDKPLYPGLFETSLCPLTDFDQNRIYKTGQEPDWAEIERRRQAYYWPYHNRLKALLERARQKHGFALLIDAHSIRPNIPSLFTEPLPILSLGTFDGKSLGQNLHGLLRALPPEIDGFSNVLDGRFKGGFTTRHYGQPNDHIHALQIEVRQDGYLNMDNPRHFDSERAAPLSQALQGLVNALLEAANQFYGAKAHG